MLPGGLAVLGLYLHAPEACVAGAAPQLCKVLAEVQRDAAAAAPGPLASGSGPLEPLLLHLDSTSRKQSLKAAAAPGAITTSSLKPCELKYGSALASLVCLRCRYAVDVTLPSSSSAAQLQQAAADVVAAEAGVLAAALATIGGAFPAGDALIGDALPAAASTSQPSDVQLFRPAAAAAAATPSSGRKPAAAAAAAAEGEWPAVAAGTEYGSSRLRGEVSGLAYAHRRESVAQALGHLKADVAHSLGVRVELLVEEALNAAEEQQEHEAEAGSAAGAKAAAPAHPLLAAAGSGSAACLALPLRVLLPWAGGLQLCDYLGEGEGAQEAAERAAMLLSLAAGAGGADGVVEVEAAGVAKPSSVVGKAVASAPGAGSSGSGAACSPSVMAGAAAAAVAAAAALVGYLNLYSS